jgi:hypothetical protein
VTIRSPSDFALRVYPERFQGLAPTAARHAGYVLLKEFAKRARGDVKLAQALKNSESSLKSFWLPQEESLVNLAKRSPGLTPEGRAVYTRTHSALWSAYLAIARLRPPE